MLNQPEAEFNSINDRKTVGQVFQNFPLTREHVKSCLILFFVFIIEAWEMMIIVYTSPLIARDLKIGPEAIGNLIGSIFIGMGIGALMWGSIAQHLGRKKTLIYSLVLYGCVSMLSCFSENYSMLYFLRFLSGLMAAGMLIVTVPYFEELLPVRVRGAFTVYLSAGWSIGILCALGATAWLSPMGWRWILGFSSVAALWAFVVAYLVPESPYWLASVGRQEKARKVILKLSRGQVSIPPQQQLYRWPFSHFKSLNSHLHWRAV